jgi:hypothetical protein
MKKARFPIRSIGLHYIDHRNWDQLCKHVHVKVRTRVWHNIGHVLVDQYSDTITDIIRKKS